MPILKDLLKDKKKGKLSKNDLKKACDGILDDKELDKQLKKLDDLGAIQEKINPKTKKKEYGMKDDKKQDDEPKLMPIIKDLLKNKLPGKLDEKDIEKACVGKIPKEDV